MLADSLLRVLMKMRLGFYRKMFTTVREQGNDLTPLEVFCLEVIEALEEPTISQFARFSGISQPNATYKVNSLTKKGYLEKVPSPGDRREYRLRLTEKFNSCGPLFEQGMRLIAKRLTLRLTPEETDKLTGILDDSLDKWNSLMEKDETLL